MKCTEMFYMYRDGDNYKFLKSILVSGNLTFEDIKPYLEGIDGLIPADVGIPSAHPVDQYKYEEDSDHPWHEINEGDFRTRTDVEAEFTKEEIIEAFRKASEAGWPGQYSFEGW